MGSKEVKADLDKLAKIFRESEAKVHDRINEADKDLSENNTNIKLVVQQVSAFMEMFKTHGKEETETYNKIEVAIIAMRDEIKSLEDKYVTKKEMNDVKEDIKVMSDAIRKGFKIFWIGSGVFLTIGVLGSLVLWIINLISQLNRIGG